MCRSEVLALIHEDMVGYVLPAHASHPLQMGCGDGRSLGEVDCRGNPSLRPVSLDDVPDTCPFGPVQSHAAAGSADLVVPLPGRNAVRQHHLGILSR